MNEPIDPLLEGADGYADEGWTDSDRTEEGYGYYRLEDEYAGDPDGAGAVRGAEPPPGHEPRHGDEPHEGHESPHGDNVARDKIPFADRNWRVPTVIVLAVAIVVIGVVILLLPDGGRVRTETSDYGSFRDKPAESATAEVPGTLVAVDTDEDSVVALTVVNRSLRLVDIDRDSGEQRWNVAIESIAGPRSTLIPKVTGTIAVSATSIQVVAVVGTADPVSWTIDAQTGETSWSADLPTSTTPAIAGPNLLVAESDSGVVLTALDTAKKRAGTTVAADWSTVIGGRVYLDTAGIVTRADAATLVTDTDFRADVDGAVTAIVEAGDAVVVAVDDTVLRIRGKAGDDIDRLDAGVAAIDTLIDLGAGLVAVGGADGIVLIDTEGGELASIGDVLADLELVTAATSGSEQRLIALDGDRLEVVRVDREGLVLDAEVAAGAADAAAIVVSDSVIYTESASAPPWLVAADLESGDQLWSLPLGAGGRILIDRTGIVTVVGNTVRIYAGT